MDQISFIDPIELRNTSLSYGFHSRTSIENLAGYLLVCFLLVFALLCVHCFGRIFLIELDYHLVILGTKIFELGFVLFMG